SSHTQARSLSVAKGQASQMWGFFCRKLKLHGSVETTPMGDGVGKTSWGLYSQSGYGVLTAYRLFICTFLNLSYTKGIEHIEHSEC
ncbi:hypothetical protein, partial [Moorena sp. SIO2C4]|uniref:hypothetical protein n=1 Tax=Moorena sp. SIO2C4 TaxID=2607824 RepID=UPI00257F8BE8